MVWSGALAPQPLALAPRVVNNNYVTSERTHSTAHAGREVLGGSPAALCGSPAWASPWKPWCAAWGLRCSSLMVGLEEAALWLSWLCYGYVVAAASERGAAVLRLPCQPGEKERVCTSHDASPFPPASSLAPYLPGFNKQCEQQDSCHCEQDQRYNIVLCEKLTKLYTEYAPVVNISIFISSNKITFIFKQSINVLIDTNMQNF